MTDYWPVKERLLQQFGKSRINHWNGRARERERYGLSRAYHALLRQRYRNIVPENLRILEIGCYKGDLLAALKPAYGVGVDFSAEAIDSARKRYPRLTFHVCDAHHLDIDPEYFDYVIISDLLNDVYDVQNVFESVRRYCDKSTRVVINSQSHLWSPLLRLCRTIGCAPKQLLQNWITVHDVKNLLTIVGFDVVSETPELLLPLPIPLAGSIANNCLAKIWPFSHLCLTHFLVARRSPDLDARRRDPSVSVIIAARNEAGHIEELLNRIPPMGGGTELIFVEGGSTDNTYDEIETRLRLFSRMKARLFRQEGRGKGDAVRLGFSMAENDVVMILDADMTVMPEELPRFYDLLVSGKTDFVNGVRLVYPMEDHAMRFFNLLGNKFFSSVFSWLLGQPVRDTLCGTKVLYRSAYLRIAEHRGYFGEFDPFGDFDLIFGAVKQNLKIMDMPVRYQARSYGETNIRRWSSGWLLLRMLVVAMRKIKFS
ncbi:bifunctional class I SAM-dependent methyltransferase/glycosyltransferase family 2 protein [Desulfofustis limnaeus]|uniref:bifunctional class I SAM-dependent methyltransferase/glycosyltransferase family 2 protein n=1 Tax=Desulfofustis limnaeus TaxID=2740163 RepID=UPI0024DF7B08|nr:bifunctional class I SAM-dependent methyltransferase/glycosyltransferase family 2 protein [Desulfofustis limnaeus]